MLKVQVALIAILIASVAFVSCERAQTVLEPVADDMMATDDTMMSLMTLIESEIYTSWAHVALPAPTMSVPDAKAAMNPAGTGAAHNPGSDVFTSRIAYFNDIGAMANKEGTTPYPYGTIIVKAIMDDTETFVDKLAVMVKSPDPTYTDNGHDGWMYAKYFLVEDGTWVLRAGSDVEAHKGIGCHNCHTEAGDTNDKVFVSLSMDDMDDDKMMDHMDEDMDGADDMMDDDTADDGMDGDAANGADANGDTNGADANGADVQ